MSQLTQEIVSAFTAQMIGAAVMALLLFGFYRQYGKAYLRHWTLAWGSLAIYHLATSATMTLTISRHLAPSHPARLSLTLLGGITSYIHIAWLVFGVYELVRRRPVRLRHARNILLGLAGFGVLVSLLFLASSEPAAHRYMTRLGLRSAVAAIACAIAAIALWRARRRSAGIGFTVLSGAFAAYSIEQIHYVWLAMVWAAAGRQADYATYLGHIDFLLQTMMGVGMIACLLEDEREAAELASQEIEHLAYHDALTGLPNRPLFIDRLIVALAQATRAQHKLAVLFLDLDRFKDINDSLGHTAGDSLLKSVADRIRQCIREGDTVARFGGDEFTLLIPRVDQIEDAVKIAQKIIDALKQPFHVSEHELFVTTSIGLSVYPTDGHDPETLVRNADTAMYRAKEQGRDNYQLYAPAMNVRALERLALENALRKAVAQNELVLHYQPLIDLQSRAIVGAEALVRWKHPDLGLLLPAHFISVAEVSGLIIPIGEWVLRTACAQIREWQPMHEAMTVSVNLSARQFQQPDLVDQIRRALEEGGVEPWRLQLEITESNAMQNAENTIYTLRELKALGVRIAMDDFGTGYSSLSYLKRFPIDTLKLDQSFVRDAATDPTDAAIVSAVIAMAHSMSLEVVAEGVETEPQLEFLTRQRCDVIQGFLFSAPMPAEALEPYLRGAVHSPS